MDSIKWERILGKIDYDQNLKNKDVIEEIRIRLAEVLPQDEHKEWEDKKFDIHHLFQVEHDEYIVKCTLLHISAALGLKYLLKDLLKAGADVNIKGQDGETPLHHAAVYDYVDIVYTLLAVNGINVNTKDKDRKTPLHYAAGMGHVEVVSALLAKGAKINARSGDGVTPLHCAAEVGYTNVIKILLEQKANPCLKDNNGKTPRDLAKMAEEEIQQCLKKAEIRIINSTKRGVATCGATAATMAGGTVIAAALITAECISVEPKNIISIAVAIVLVSLAVGYNVYQVFKEHGTKVNATQIPVDDKNLGTWML